MNSTRRRGRHRKLLGPVLLLTASVLSSSPCLALDMTFHVGPPSVGNGGSNPISIPPLNPIEYELTFVTSKNFETNIAITPGLLFGKRERFSQGFYASYGGGLIINANGTGPGGYTAFGIDRGDKWRFNLEYKQAVGISLASGKLLNPYAVRIGVTYAL